MNAYDYVIPAPMTGKVVALKDVDDIAFASGSIGSGIAIEPTEGKVYSPFDGIIETIFYTNHIVGLSSDKGIELIIHIGIDTIKLDGNYFHANFFEGAKVQRGDLLLDFDVEAIKADGFSLVSPVVVVNGINYSEIYTTDKDFVEYNDDLIFIKEYKLTI